MGGHGFSIVLNASAEAFYYGGRYDAGLTLLQEVEVLIQDTGERIAETELHWLRGRFLQRQGDVTPAEACFHHALLLARQQHAKGAELRVAASLSRLWHERGEGEKARQLLLPIYGWFTEGFETTELLEAKALLGALT